MTGEFSISFPGVFCAQSYIHGRGGMVVWRCAAYYPSLVTHLFAICTPYQAPTKHYISTEDLVKGPVPQFGYQIHLASGELERRINDAKSIRQFLNGMYGARTPEGEVMFSPETGVLFDKLPGIGKTRLLTDKARVLFYDLQLFVVS
jgi:soluble epoxide hydrolase/lipid-phosphate phosphatase